MPIISASLPPTKFYPPARRGFAQDGQGDCRKMHWRDAIAGAEGARGERMEGRDGLWKIRFRALTVAQGPEGQFPQAVSAAVYIPDAAFSFSLFPFPFLLILFFFPEDGDDDGDEGDSPPQAPKKTDSHSASSP